MISFIEENYESLKSLCKQYRVKRFEVFGSALTGEGFDAGKSDLDFLVEFLPLQPGEHADAYFGLLEALQDLFSRSIDLVETKAIRNPYFLESINQNRKEIYAA
jgi:predicted nucleotidyltransferase